MRTACSLARRCRPELTFPRRSNLAVKTPTEEKPQPVIEASAPAAAAPVEPAVATEAPATTTAPETVALAEASASATAPVPQIVEPAGKAVDEPTEEQVKEFAEAEKPVEPVVAAEEKKDEVKVDESVRFASLSSRRLVDIVLVRD